jgi:hypothetical protein
MSQAEDCRNQTCHLDQIIFSSRDGYVWVSWRETDATVKLGRHEIVAAMMQDFLAQDALGLRLAKHCAEVPTQRRVEGH